MSINESNLVPADLNGPNTLPAQRINGGESPMAVWGGAVAAEPSATIYLHSFRRHWFIASLLGLVLAGVAGAVTWLAYGSRYEATAFIRVATSQEQIIASARPYNDLVEYEIFKNTQLQLVKSRLVLVAALRNPDVVPLQLDQRENDPTAWLADELIVRYPGRAEIMEVAMRSRDPKEARALVQAVVDAYLQDVVNVDARRRRERLNDLDRIYSDKEAEVRQVRTNLKALAETLGSSEKETITLKQQIAMQQVGEFSRQLMLAQFELQKTKNDLDAQQALYDRVDDEEITSYDIDAIARQDPVARELANEVAWRRMDMAYMHSVSVAARQDKNMSRHKSDYDSMQMQLTEVHNAIREGIRGMRRSEISREIQQLEAKFNGLMEFEKRLSAEVQQKRQEADKLSGYSIDLEMMRNQITQLETALKQISDERERLRVEQRSAPRITPIQAAEVPQSEYMPSIRYVLTALAGLVAFAIPVGLIVWTDSRAKRVNSAEEISHGLGLAVVGTLPIIPARIARRLGRASDHQRGWRARLTEAVDGVSAHVLRVATAEDARVVLITSAAGGEGKTTIATQLAMSLARNGRRTVLVDFSLRRPVLDQVFNLPEEPGACEWLRKEAGLEEIVHETAVDDLSVITAGVWDRQALAALAKGSVSELFRQLREQFDFVIVDGSPVLPVADTRFVSQHVDVSLLTVFRDVSQLPKVQAARDLLEAFGSRRLETVVIGPGDHTGDRYSG
jgi:capsular exopolysaccharide synthesis family protein